MYSYGAEFTVWGFEISYFLATLWLTDGLQIWCLLIFYYPSDGPNCFWRPSIVPVLGREHSQVSTTGMLFVTWHVYKYKGGAKALYVWPRLKCIPCISEHWFHMWCYVHLLYFKVVLNKYVYHRPNKLLFQYFLGVCTNWHVSYINISLILQGLS